MMKTSDCGKNWMWLRAGMNLVVKMLNECCKSRNMRVYVDVMNRFHSHVREKRP